MIKLPCFSLTFFLCTIFLFSCQTGLNPEQFDTEPKIVVHCLFTSDEPWKVNLSASKNVLNDDIKPEWLAKASIRITGSDGSVVSDFFYQGEGTYISFQSLPRVDTRYELKVSHDGFKDVFATGMIPRAYDLHALNMEKVEQNGKTWNRLFVELKDLGNYEHLIISNRIKKAYLSHSGDTLQFEELAFIAPDQDFKNVFDLKLKDVLYNKLFIKNISFHKFAILSQDGFRKPSDGNLISANSIWQFYFGSEAFYSYFYAISHLNFKSDLSEPVIIFNSDNFSNVSNGYGIFAGFNTRVYENSF